MYFICVVCISVAANKGEAEPERKETRTKVDEDRKHEYPFIITYVSVCLDVCLSLPTYLERDVAPW